MRDSITTATARPNAVGQRCERDGEIDNFARRVNPAPDESCVDTGVHSCSVKATHLDHCRIVIRPDGRSSIRSGWHRRSSTCIA